MNRLKVTSFRFLKITSIFVLVSIIITGCSATIDKILLSLANRPQTPKERPYTIREVSFPGGEEGVNLAGELTMPHNSGSFPAVVMVTGSAKLDRNNEFAKHKPFLVIADYLTKNGYTVLRCDDRGVGKSTGDFDDATTLDFAKDAAAAMKWLKNQKNIDLSKVGYLGHSEGGIKAPLAALEEEADFLILLASPIIGFERTAVEQRIAFAKADGKSNADIEKIEKVTKKIISIIKSDLPHNEIIEQYIAIVNKNKKIFPSWSLKELPPTTTAKEISKEIRIKWQRWLYYHDPLPVLKGFDRPVLALYGGTDALVSSVSNAPVMQGAFNHKNSKIITYPTLNHFFQPAKKGTIEEIPYIDITFDEGVLKDMVKWLKEI
jgi:alpha/beta superfamily hydrolase